MLKVALSHDIDRVYKHHQYLTKSIAHLIRLNGKGFINQLKSIGDQRPYWTFDQLIEMEENFNVRSTFFFLNESIKLNPFSLNSYKLSLGRYNVLDPEIAQTIRYLDKNGWEIGVHGSYNSYKDSKLLTIEKKTLEMIVGHPIIGIRQHYLNLNDNTWQIQNDVGFKYDSSWGFTNDIGFRNNRYTPFRPLSNDFKVIPLTLMDSCFMAKPNKWDEYEKLLDKCELTGAVMVINFHQHVFYEHDFPGYKEAYIKLIKRAIKRCAKFYTLSQVFAGASL